MIHSAEEFVKLREEDSPRATLDTATKEVWLEVIQFHPAFKAWIVHNKTVPVSILRLLASDSDAAVRFAVAMKRKCPVDVLKRLAQDEDESVRGRVAWNAKTPPQVLEMLRHDTCKDVAKVVASRLGRNLSPDEDE